MSDNPPPRKKSRFFSNGKSKLGNILHPFRRPTAQAGPGSDNGTLVPGAPTTVDGLPPAPPSSSQHGNGMVTTEVSESEAETDHEDGDDIDHGDRRDLDRGDSDQENANPNLHTSMRTTTPNATSVRSSRRQGIYGVESLLHQVGNASVPGPSSQQGQTTAPAHGPSAGSARAMVGEQHGTQATNSGSVLLSTPGGSSQTQFIFSGASSLARPAGQYGQPGLGAGGLPPIPESARDSMSFTFRTPQQMQNAPSTTTAASDGNRRAANPVIPSRPLPAALPTGGTAPYVDMDRDEQGRRLSVLPDFIDHRSAALRPVVAAPHLANPDSLVPENMYTSPDRVERAKKHARISLKRKRPHHILPPPSYVYRRTDDPDFNVFHGILLYPELVFALSAALPVKDLVSLYAISRDFHTIVDTRFTTVVLSQAVSKAPQSARTFGFRSYAHLCRTDPAARIPHPNRQLAARAIPRKIPSFRWLKMVLHREKVVHELVTVFAEEGTPVPFRCRLALTRLWFILDLPDNARRIGFVHNRGLLTDLDLYFAACFFAKLDMCLNDPAGGEKRDGMRKLLLSQRSLTTLLLVLKREIWTSKLDVMREWVKLKYEPLEDERGMPIFGVPADRVGKGRLEYWGLRSEQQLGRAPGVLLRPDQLIVREALRRRMPFDRHYVRFMLYGYVRPDTLEDYAPRPYGRRIDALKDDEYEVDDLVGGVAALDVGDEGFDDLLDLGPPRQGSAYTVVKDRVGRDERKLRSDQEQLTAACMAWWEAECEKDDTSESEDESESESGDTDGDDSMDDL